MAAKPRARRPGKLEARARRATAGVDLGQPFGPVLVELAIALGRSFDGPSRPQHLVEHLSDAAAGVAVCREGTSGPIETQVRRDLEALDTIHPAARSLTELAITQARQLDGTPDLGTAKLSAELRATLHELWAQRKVVGDDQDPEDALSEPG